MSKIRVTQVLWTLGRAGAERVVLDLARGLPKDMFEVNVLAAAGGGPMEQDFKAEKIPLSVGPRAIYAWQRGKTMRFLLNAVKKNPPQIWHTHLGGDVWGGRVAMKKNLHPWIITAHGEMREERWPTSGLRRWAYEHADHIVCVSEALKQLIRQRYHITEKKLSVIRIGFDVSVFAALPPRQVDLPLRLLCISRLVPVKNYEMLFHALALIRMPWHLTIVGEGPLRRSLQKLADHLCIKERIDMVGETDDIRSYLADAHVFCFPSIHEGQGLSLLEAAASGLPAIASPLPAIQELFSSSSMRFVPSHSVKLWARAIEDTALHYDAALTRAARARKIVQERCSLDRMVQEYAALYHKLFT